MRRILPPLLLALLAGCFAPPPADNVLVGKVVSVADGDTLTVLVGKTQHRIRLHGVDCPDSGQPFRTRAKQFTADASLETIETKACIACVGVWSDSNPIPPWEWRHARDDGSVPDNANRVAYDGYWLNEASGAEARQRQLQLQLQLSRTLEDAGG